MKDEVPCGYTLEEPRKCQADGSKRMIEHPAHLVCGGKDWTFALRDGIVVDSEEARKAMKQAIGLLIDLIEGPPR